MSRISPTFRRVLVRAFMWANKTGWPTKAQDLAVTADVVRAFAGQDANLTREILKALSRAGVAEGLRHRVVLCRVAARLASVTGQVSPAS